MEAEVAIRLTQYSHGAGCGCKIAPRVLDEILSTNKAYPGDARILVGNDARDDAAVYDLGNGQGLVSTTDFFMPIVDDPYTFGRIAAANAISDVYAMGGTPVLAIAILGWPVGKLSPELARAVVEGGRDTCRAAGIALAGGHSIDNPEPVFGLAVNGLVSLEHLKPNNAAQAGDLLFLTKPLGVGILTTAQKRGLCTLEDARLAAEQMMALNAVGAELARIPGVHAMTDVTGFGLLGHLLELCEGSRVAAELDFERIPLIADLSPYLEAGATPGGAQRNWESYGNLIGPLSDRQRAILADPQTSGGLLVAAAPESAAAVADVLSAAGLGRFVQPIGRLLPGSGPVLVSVR